MLLNAVNERPRSYREIKLQRDKPSGPMRDPPRIAQILFEIVSQRGYRTPFALFSFDIVQVLLRYRFCVGGGVSHLHFACSPRKKGTEMGEGYRTEFVMLRHPRSQRGGIAEILSRYRNIGGH